MIEIQNITLKYGSRVLIDSASATIGQGILTALIGRNGCGKSTLLRALAGVERPYSGKVAINSADIYNMSQLERARKVSVVSTGRIGMSNLRCKNVVAMGRAPYTGWTGCLSAEDTDIVEKAMNMVGVANLSTRFIDTLSDGEYQRVMIARALAQDTDVILLDEPTSFLDMPGRYDIANLLKDLACNQLKTIIFSTHELDLAIRLCDNLLMIKDSRLYSGETAREAATRIVRSLLNRDDKARP